MSLLEQVVYIAVLGNGCVEVSLRILCAGFSVFRVDEFGCWGIRAAFGEDLLRWWLLVLSTEWSFKEVFWQTSFCHSHGDCGLSLMRLLRGELCTYIFDLV